MSPAARRAGIPWLAVAISLAAFVGCKPKERIPGKWFAGQPVEHWLEAIRAPEAGVRRRAAEVLGNVGAADTRSVAALADALADPDRRVRDEAVLGLSKIGPVASDSAPAIQNLLRQEKDPQVVAHAKAALSRVMPRSTIHDTGSTDVDPAAKPAP